MKFAGYAPADSDGSDQNAPKAFSAVVLDSFSKADSSITYTISATFDPIIFSTIQTDAKDAEGNPISQLDAVRLIVPDRVTTRSEVEKPGALFQPNPSGEGVE